MDSDLSDGLMNQPSKGAQRAVENDSSLKALHAEEEAMARAGVDQNNIGRALQFSKEYNSAPATRQEMHAQIDANEQAELAKMAAYAAEDRARGAAWQAERSKVRDEGEAVARAEAERTRMAAEQEARQARLKEQLAQHPAYQPEKAGAGSRVIAFLKNLFGIKKAA